MQALVESMDDIAFEIDEQGTYLNVWTANEAFLVRPKKGLIGHRIGHVLGEDCARPFLEAFKRVLATGRSASIEYELDLSGGRRWFSGHISPVCSEQRVDNRFCVFVREITEHKRAEEALKASEERLRSVLQGLDVGVALVGPGTEVLLFNDAALELLGLTRE